MRWVLQNNIFNEAGWDKLVEVLGRFGLPFYEFKVIPFVGELYPEPDPSLGNEPVICFGSYSMRHAAKKYGWSPGVFDLQAEINTLNSAGFYAADVQRLVMALEDAFS